MPGPRYVRGGETSAFLYLHSLKASVPDGIKDALLVEGHMQRFS